MLIALVGRRRRRDGDSRILFQDDFNRADSALTLGAPWVTGGTSVWGISTNRAYLATSGAPDIAYVDAGTANVRVTATVAVLDTLWNWWLVCRVVDGSNYFKVQVPGAGSDGNFYLTRVTADVGTDIDSGAITVSAGDTISLECSGNAIKVYHNAVEVGSATDAQGNTAELHGMGAGNGNGTQRWDNFVITAA